MLVAQTKRPMVFSRSLRQALGLSRRACICAMHFSILACVSWMVSSLKLTAHPHHVMASWNWAFFQLIGALIACKKITSSVDNALLLISHRDPKLTKHKAH